VLGRKRCGYKCITVSNILISAGPENGNIKKSLNLEGISGKE
jgi:hypothetical protein